MEDNVNEVEVTIEDLLADALQENDAAIRATLPGTEEHERLAKERDMLLKVWLDLNKQKADSNVKEESKWHKILEGAKSATDILAKVLQVGGSLAIAVGIVRLGNREGFMSADEFKGLSMVERLLVKNS